MMVHADPWRQQIALLAMREQAALADAPFQSIGLQHGIARMKAVKTTNTDAVLAVIKTGSHYSGEIAAATGLHRDTVRKILNELRADGQAMQFGDRGRWRAVK